MNADPLLLELFADDDSATQASFVQLCRHSPAFRRWLWREFVRDSAVRASVARVIKDGNGAPGDGPRGCGALADEARSWRVEQRHLRQQSPRLARPYGGLTYDETVSLARQHQAGTVDLATFLLAHDWRLAGIKAKNSAALGRVAT